MSSERLGENIKAKLSDDGNKLVLTIRLDKAGRVSASGKSTVIASSGRNCYLGCFGDENSDLGLNLNLFRLKNSRRRKAEASDESSD